MSNIEYVQAVPRIRAVENKLLDRAKIQRLLDSTSADEAFKVLQETDYGTLMAEVKRPEDYEIVLSRELVRLYSFMYEITPEKKLIDIMSIRYDYHNIKVLLKSKILGKDFKEILIPVGTIDVNILTKWILNENYKDIPKTMKEAIEKSMEVFEEEKDPQKIDVVLDNYMYKDMMMRAKEINDDYLLKFLKINIDLINLKTLLRVKKQDKSRNFLKEVLLDNGDIKKEEFIEMFNLNVENIVNKLQYTNYTDVIKVGIEEYTESKNLKVLEKLSDNFIMDFIKDAKYVSFGSEPLIAYIFAKENEIKIVRIIMVGKLNNIDADVIRERLRDIYV